MNGHGTAAQEVPYGLVLWDGTDGAPGPNWLWARHLLGTNRALQSSSVQRSLTIWDKLEGSVMAQQLAFCTFIEMSYFLQRE